MLTEREVVLVGVSAVGDVHLALPPEVLIVVRLSYKKNCGHPGGGGGVD